MNALASGPLHGEILAPGATLAVVAALHPMTLEKRIVDVPVGMSLAEIVEACLSGEMARRFVPSLQVTIGGEPVARDVWHRVRPKAGTLVVVRAVPGKAMGGLWRALLQVALIITATFLLGPAGLGLSGAVLAGAAAAAGFVINLALNKLFPPSSTSSDGRTKTVYSIAGARNEISKWAPIPALLGTTRVFPKYAAAPFTEFDGDDQYVRMLLVWGLGPIDIGEIRLGETPLSHFSGVEVQTYQGYATDPQQTLYTLERVQDDFQLDVTKEYSPLRRYTGDEAAEIQIDLSAPSGIYNIDMKKGKKGPMTVEGSIELRDADSGAVVASQAWNFTAKSADPIRRTYRFAGLPGTKQYEVFVSRATDDYEGSDDRMGAIVWSAIRTIRNSPPIEYGKPLAITALRIRATKQLNSVPDEVNALCTSRAQSWDGRNWVPNQPTNWPHDLFRLVLQGPGNARPVPTELLDLPTIEAWGDYCRRNGFTFNMYRDFSSSLRDTLRDICAAGRAVPLFRDGRWSVAWEDGAAPIVQHFTPRNSRDFSWHPSYRELPHALRVKFKNAKRGYIEDERLVYDDGFSKGNASLFEQAEFPGVDDPDLVYKHGRYRIAETRLRSSIYRLTADFEYLVCTRGDRVRVAHDVIQVGLQQGRVKAVTDLVKLDLDEGVFMEAGKSYGIVIRHRDGSSSVRTVATAPGWQTRVTISSAGAEPGALFMFGLVGQETITCRVLSIKPGEDLSAELELVDDAPGVQDADTGPITGEPGTVTVPTVIARPVMRGLSAYVDAGSGAYMLIADYPRILGAKRYVGEISTDGGTNWRTVFQGTDTRWTVPVEKDALLLRAAAFGPVEMGPWQQIAVDPSAFPTKELTEEVTFKNLQKQLREEIELISSQGDGSLSQLRDEMRASLDDLARLAASTADRAVEQRQVVREQIVAASDLASAMVREEREVRLKGDEAQAKYTLEAVAANKKGYEAAVKTELDARVEGDKALAQQITSVLAQSNLGSASGYYKIQAIADGPTGRSRFEVFLNAGTKAAPNWARAGFVMEAWMDGDIPRSRVVFLTDQFVIARTRNAETQAPFSVIDGVVYIDRAYIRDLTATNLAAGAVTDVYENSGSATAALKWKTPILTRIITIQPYERLVINASYMAKAPVSIESETMYIGTARLQLGGTILSTIPIVGPGVDHYSVYNGAFSASFANGANTLTNRELTIEFEISDGGTVENGVAYGGLLTGDVQVDSVSMTTLRCKR